MKKSTKTLKTIAQIQSLMFSRENVNSNDVSSDDIALAIASEGWNRGDSFIVAGEKVPRHNEGEVMDGNNGLHALHTLMKIFNEKEFLSMIGKGIEIEIVSNCTVEEIADIYNKEGIKKRLTIPQIARKFKKYVEIDDSSEADAAIKLKGSLDTLFRISGKTLDKYTTLQESLKAGSITHGQFKSEYAKIRRGTTTLLKFISVNEITLSMADKKYEGEGEFSDLGTLATKAEFKELFSGYAKDFKCVDDKGVKTFSHADLQSGNTPEFQKALENVMKCLKLKASAEKTPKLTMESRSQLQAQLENSSSAMLQRILSVIIHMDTETTLNTLDKELLKFELPEVETKTSKVVNTTLVDKLKAANKK